jgi:YidC/Oxa1 family membrane protein insertase
MIAFLKTIIYVPLYNALVLLLSIPYVDAGLAAVILTVAVKIILYPIAKKSIVTQAILKEKEGELNSIKQRYHDKQEQALKVMEFYKSNNINPFSSILTLLIQIPIIYSLYYIFFRSGLPAIDASILYSFVRAPQEVSMNFLGFFDVASKSMFLAALAAITSFIQIHLSSPSQPAAQGKEDFAAMMNKQMKFTMPLIVFFISWRISGVVALYWFVSNVVGTLQDMYVRRQIREKKI